MGTAMPSTRRQALQTSREGTDTKRADRPWLPFRRPYSDRFKAIAHQPARESVYKGCSTLRARTRTYAEEKHEICEPFCDPPALVVLDQRQQSTAKRNQKRSRGLWRPGTARRAHRRHRQRHLPAVRRQGESRRSADRNDIPTANGRPSSAQDASAQTRAAKLKDWQPRKGVGEGDRIVRAE